MAARGFGKYEVLARLATGGAASIFLARQPGVAGFNKLVVLKTLLPDRARDDDFVAMFLDEARLAARLNHPNCVQIYDLGRVRGVYYISMEYIFGETVWSLLTTVTKVREPLPTSSVAHIIAGACDGLHHAHELKDGQGKAYNLVHRDVSPQNIMITFEGQTKVLDFGIAKAETGRAATMAGIVKGKFSYMSPEQIAGGQLDRRSDIYSLGIVMFECLASRRLYRGDTPEDIAKLILEHRAPRLREVVPDIPEPLDEICARALARAPAQRYASAQQMGEAIRNYLDDVRYAQSASTLSKLLKERFGDTIESRRQVFEGALAPDYDEGRLLELLDARKVLDLDLFPDAGDAVLAADFLETGTAHEVPGLRSESVTQNPGMSAGAIQGAGFRVELEPSQDPRPPPGVSQDYLRDEDDDFGDDETRVGADTSARTTLDGFVDESMPAGEADRTQDHRIEGSMAQTGPAGFGRLPSFGSAVAEIEARLANIAVTGGPSDTVDASEGEPVSLSGTSDTTITPSWSGDALGAAPFAISDPAITGPLHVPDSIAVVASAALAPGPAPVEQPQLRFGLSAVLAALGVGVSLGMVLGLVMALVAFDRAPAAQPDSGRVVDLGD